MSSNTSGTDPLVRARPASFDWRAAAMAALAALLVFRFHRGLIEVVATMALLGAMLRVWLS